MSEKPTPKPEPKYLYLTYEETVTGGERTSDEPYSQRTPRHTTVQFKTLARKQGDKFFPHTVEVTDDVHAAEVVFLVIPRYYDGDSFGTSRGLWAVWAAVKTEDEALKIQRDIESGALHKDGKYLPWEGHFCGLEGVEVHAFRVGETSHVHYH